MTLGAVVFDLDGTLVDSEQEGHRVAFNRAFAEAGLPHRWDRPTYRALLAVPGGVPRLRHYLCSQGVPASEGLGMAQRLHALKVAQLERMISAGAVPLRPGVAELLDDLRRAGVRLAVATTGSGSWVGPLLDSLAPGVFEVVVTGPQVASLKPAPDCYLLALRRLGLGAGEVLAVEDSEPGCTAAVRAGLACVVVTNSDTAGGVFTGAALVVSGFEGPPAGRVIADPCEVAPGLPLRSAGLAAVLAKVARSRLRPFPSGDDGRRSTAPC